MVFVREAPSNYEAFIGVVTLPYGYMHRWIKWDKWGSSGNSLRFSCPT